MYIVKLTSENFISKGGRIFKNRERMCPRLKKEYMIWEALPSNAVIFDMTTLLKNEIFLKMLYTIKCC